MGDLVSVWLWNAGHHAFRLVKGTGQRAGEQHASGPDRARPVQVGRCCPQRHAGGLVITRPRHSSGPMDRLFVRQGTSAGFIMDFGGPAPDREKLAARVLDRAAGLPALNLLAPAPGERQQWWRPVSGSLDRAVHFREGVLLPAGLDAATGALLRRPLPSDPHPPWDMWLLEDSARRALSDLLSRPSRHSGRGRRSSRRACPAGRPGCTGTVSASACCARPSRGFAGGTRFLASRAPGEALGRAAGTTVAPCPVALPGRARSARA